MGRVISLKEVELSIGIAELLLQPPIAMINSHE